MFVGCPNGTRDWHLVPADIGATRLSHAVLPVWFRQQAAGSGFAAGGFLRPVSIVMDDHTRRSHEAGAQLGFLPDSSPRFGSGEQLTYT